MPAHVRQIEHLDHFAVQFVDDRRWRARWREDTPPRIGGDILVTFLDQRRHIGQRHRACITGGGQHTHAAVIGKRCHQRGGADAQIDLPTDHRHRHRSAAFVRHVHQLEATALSGQRQCEMPEAAGADRAVGQCVGFGFRRPHHVAHGFVRLRRRGDDAVRRAADQHHRREVFQRIEGQVRNQRRVHRMRIKHKHIGITVGIGFCRNAGADGA